MPTGGQANTGLMSVLERTASGPHGASPAVTFEGETLTYRELLDRTYAVANGLVEAGVRKGDRVAVLLRNGFEWFELLFALAEVGAICAPVNIFLKPNEIKYLCEDSEARVLIVDEGGSDAVSAADVGTEIVVGVGGAKPEVPHATHFDYEELRANGAPRPTGVPVAIHDPFILYYSSGTTGLPKGALQTHENILWNSVAQIPDMGITPEDVYLNVPSLSWAAGFHSSTLPCLWVGGHVVVLSSGGASIEKVIGTAAAHGVTRTLLVPTLLRQLLASPECQRQILESPLRWIISGAEAVPLNLIEALTEALPGVRIVQGYGMSEGPALACVLQPEDAVSHAGSAGRPVSVCRIAVELPDGTVADRGEGEVLIRSPATMLGYWRRPEETAAALAGGWLHSGDIGLIDEEGYLKITGRKKDMVISGGLNVYPSEVENVIGKLSGVRENAVVGLADERLGEVPVAIVVLDDERAAELILPHCRELLAGYKVPKKVVVRDHPLPRNPNGKVLKRELRPWLAEHLERQPAD